MQHLRRICAVVVLTCALAATTFAGDIGFGFAPPPPPPPPSSAPGIMGTLGVAAAKAETTLNLLQSVLLLF